jgi:hypothetical protein
MKKKIIISKAIDNLIENAVKNYLVTGDSRFLISVPNRALKRALLKAISREDK